MAVQKDVPERAAAQGRDHAERVDADEVHSLLPGRVESRQGEGDDAQDFNCSDEGVHKAASGRSQWLLRGAGCGLKSFTSQRATGYKNIRVDMSNPGKYHNPSSC